MSCVPNGRPRDVHPRGRSLVVLPMPKNRMSSGNTPIPVTTFWKSWPPDVTCRSSKRICSWRPPGAAPDKTWLGTVQDCVTGAGVRNSVPILASPLQRASDKLAHRGPIRRPFVLGIGHGRLVPSLRQDSYAQERRHGRGVCLDDDILRKRFLPDRGNAGLRRRRPESGDKSRKERGRAIRQAQPMLSHHPPQLRDACAGLRHSGRLPDTGRRPNFRRREFQQRQRGVGLDGSRDQTKCHRHGLSRRLRSVLESRRSGARR